MVPSISEQDIPTSFDELELSDTMRAALAKAEYTTATPVQAALIPLALSGKDVLGQARTGTGKTAAFGIPLLEMIDSRATSSPQALILVPTRELAVQVRDECGKLGHGNKSKVIAVYGGKPIRKQIDQLNRGVQIVVGTPGRVIDLIGRGVLLLEGLTHVVLDEADRMLDIGFRPDIEKILRKCPAKRQTLLLSATVPPPVERLSKRYMTDPETIDCSTGEIGGQTIEQFYFTVDQDRKPGLLLKLLQREEPEQAIVFCRTKAGTDRTHKRLARKLNGVGCIHGDLPQGTRDKVMAQFRAGELKILVATDVVGRGIDVSGISHIINNDIPAFCDDYVHRVGRTGRMGREGVAYTFVTPEEGAELTRIEVRINKVLTRDDFADYEATKPIIPVDETAPKKKPGPGARTRRIRRAL